MRVGCASVEITPRELLNLQGQMHERVARYTRDPLLASAVAFEDGGAPVVLVSCDLVGIPDALGQQLQQACEERLGIPAQQVLFGATHTHVGPCMLQFHIPQKINASYQAWLFEQLIEVVQQALADLSPASLFAGNGWVEQMGWNRMGLHSDGRADMYHGSWNADFAGVVGPRDGDVPVIFAADEQGTVRCVVTGFASHPNCVEGETFYSADLVGEARKFVRQALGQQVVMAYFTGAAGDTAPSIMQNNPHNVQPWRGEKGVVRSGRYLGAEIVKVITSAIEPMNEPTLQLQQTVVHAGYRPWPADFDGINHPNAGMRAYFGVAQREWPEFVKQPPHPVRLNVLRLGDAAICTNPAELYVQLGLDMKKDSPARVTMVAQLTDGYCGYVCTRKAFDHGGYSTWPSDTSKLAHDAGDQMVAATKQLLATAFANAPAGVAAAR